MLNLAKKMKQVLYLQVDDLLTVFTSQMRGLYVLNAPQLYNPFRRVNLPSHLFLAHFGLTNLPLYAFFRAQSFIF